MASPQDAEEYVKRTPYVKLDSHNEKITINASKTDLIHCIEILKEANEGINSYKDALDYIFDNLEYEG